MSSGELTKFELRRHAAVPAGGDELGIADVKLLLPAIARDLDGRPNDRPTLISTVSRQSSTCQIAARITRSLRAETRAMIEGRNAQGRAALPTHCSVPGRGDRAQQLGRSRTASIARRADYRARDMRVSSPSILPDTDRTSVTPRDADTERLTAKQVTGKSAAAPPEGGAVRSLRRWLSAEEFVHLAGRCSRVGPEVR
jgi:hypothetical protein